MISKRGPQTQPSREKLRRSPHNSTLSAVVSVVALGARSHTPSFALCSLFPAASRDAALSRLRKRRTRSERRSRLDSTRRQRLRSPLKTRAERSLKRHFLRC
eukprot:scaffold1220_cov259-Pinguiococcus_pyrenoidosus.AAC.132